MERGPDSTVDTVLAPTLAPLDMRPAPALRQLAKLGFRRVQLSATQPGLRPRELDRSARRDLAATLRRCEMEAAGIDLWIPSDHFLEAAHVDRAAATVIEAIRLAADLGRCPLSCLLPAQDGASTLGSVIDTLSEAALRHGVALADHAVAAADREGIGVGIDPAAWLADGADPVEGAAAAGDRMTSARLCDLLAGGSRGPVGEGGRLDLAAYRMVLRLRGEALPVVIDARQWGDPWDGIRRSAAAWAAAGR